MQRFSFKKGLTFIQLNTRWQLIRRLVTGKLQFESDQGEILNLTDKEILKLWNSSEWVIDESSLGIEGDAIYLVTPADLSTYPLKWQKIAERRMHYLNALDPDSNKYNPTLWKERIADAALTISDPKPPSAISVQTWWKRYRVTKSINTLLPRVKNGSTRKEDTRYTIFEDVIQKAYLNVQKLPVADICDLVHRRITLQNLSRSSEDQIKQISRPTIYRWIKNLRADIKDSSRLGAEIARKKYRLISGGLEVEHIFERIEIDHTPLDLIVIDKDTQLPLGRAWLTLAIDKFSRIVTGFYISFNAPSSYSVLQCLKQMILPKNDLLKRFDNIKNDWPVFGIPELLALDNGMDLHSDALKKTCLELGIQILYCPAATPEMKGSIERFFRTINQGLIHKLPGTTFSNISERGDYPAEKLAAIDMETLLHLITKWIVDVYNVTPHSEIEDTPLHKWTDSAKYKTLELPVYPTQIDVITGIPAKRTVFHYGIELEGLHYNNPQLLEMRKISGVNLQVDLKFYEDQVHFIDVFDPYTKEYIRVEAVHESYAQGLHRETHRLNRVQARKKFGEQFSMPQLMESREEIRTMIQQAITSKKMANRKQAANLRMYDSVSVFESKSPLKNLGQTPKHGIRKAPEPLDSGLDDDLPNVNGKRNDDEGETV